MNPDWRCDLQTDGKRNIALYCGTYQCPADITGLGRNLQIIAVCSIGKEAVQMWDTEEEYRAKQRNHSRGPHCREFGFSNT
jgi:hypothetical protein